MLRTRPKEDGTNEISVQETRSYSFGQNDIKSRNDFKRTEKSEVMTASKQLKYADVGINLGDPIFQGIYHGKKVHDDDLKEVIQRAKNVGCSKFMITGSSLKESEHVFELVKNYPDTCYGTVGIHPCSSQELEEAPGGAETILDGLRALALKGKESGQIVAFGEIGLDYDRLFLASKETQLKAFEQQLEIAMEIQLPLFLHMRAASDDFQRLLAPRLNRLPRRGLVHSFTGTEEEMRRLVDQGFDIGINGCSLKTEENVEVVKQIPIERLQIETDGPWCDMRPSHASSKYLEGAPDLGVKLVKKEKWERGLMVKGRNEPVTIAHVAHVVAKIRGIPVEELCQAAWNNSINMFGLGATESST